jgi:hypothetical protein
LEDDVARLIAESDIRRVIYRYSRGIDRMDRALVRSCFHDNAVIELGPFRGSADEFVSSTFEGLPHYAMTMHVVANLLIELDPSGAGARVESYALSFQRTALRPPDVSADSGDQRSDFDNVAVGNRFVDHFEVRAIAPGDRPEWRMIRRIAVTEWLRTDPPQDWLPVPAGFRQAHRDERDAIYTD